MRTLVVNAGSSSLKLRVLDDGEIGETRDLAADEHGVNREALSAFLDEVQVDAVGHRVVHGGTDFTSPTLLTPDVVSALRTLTELAPLHQPRSLDGIDAMSELRPDVPAVACFDTAFHAGMPAAATTYALPERWRTTWPLRRFGFHGLSHAYASRRAAELVNHSANGLRIVVCHLGAGASLCAVRDGRSVETTMGFTPLEGLVMATRSGSVDPGLVLWLQERAELSAAEIGDALEHESGLVGLGGTADMQDLLTRTALQDERAVLAVDVYVHRLVGAIGRWPLRPGDSTSSSSPAASVRTRLSSAHEPPASSPSSASPWTAYETPRRAVTKTSAHHRPMCGRSSCRHARTSR